MKNIQMTIQELTNLRKERGIQQKQVADYLNVSKAYISNIESGKRSANELFVKNYFEAISELSKTIQKINLESRVTQLEKDCYSENSVTTENLNVALCLLEDIKEYPILQAKVHVCLAILYRSSEIRDYDTAIEYVQKAIDFYRFNLKEYQVEYAEALFELASIYMRTDKQVIAEEIFNMVNDVLELTEPDHLYRYLSLGSIAMIASYFGREEEALSYINMCDQLAYTVKWNGDKWDSEVLEKYKIQMQCVFCYAKANMAENKEDYSTAITEYINCLKIMRESKLNSFTLKLQEFHTLEYIGNLYIKLSDYKNAEKYLLESITEKEKYPISHPSFYLNGLNYLSKCYIYTEQFDKALCYAQKVIDYDSNDLIPKAIAYRNMGRIFNLRDRNLSAYRDYLNKAIQLLTKHEAYHKLDLYDELIKELSEITIMEEKIVHDSYMDFLNCPDHHI